MWRKRKNEIEFSVLGGSSRHHKFTALVRCCNACYNCCNDCNVNCYIDKEQIRMSNAEILMLCGFAFIWGLCIGICVGRHI